MLHRQGQLVGPGAEQGALHPDDVPQVHQALEAGEGLVAHHLLLHVDLQTAGAVLEMGEGGLAELPQQHQAAGQAEFLAQPLQFSPAEEPRIPRSPGPGYGWGRT